MTVENVPPADGSVQRVALRVDVDERVQRLRALAAQVTTDALTFAELLLREHEADLWQRARTPDAGHYPSEETFWEDALGIRRRTGFQCLRRGKTLAALQLPPEERAALASVGLHKFDVIAPVLMKERTVEAARHWTAKAHELDRDQLRDAVNHALGRPTRSRSGSQRLRDYIVNAMPDVESREVVEAFFVSGATYVESASAIAILLAGMAEALSTRHAHAEPTATLRDTDVAGEPEGTSR